MESLNSVRTIVANGNGRSNWDEIDGSVCKTYYDMYILMHRVHSIYIYTRNIYVYQIWYDESYHLLIFPSNKKIKKIKNNTNRIIKKNMSSYIALKSFSIDTLVSSLYTYIIIYYILTFSIQRERATLKRVKVKISTAVSVLS